MSGCSVAYNNTITKAETGQQRKVIALLHVQRLQITLRRLIFIEHSEGVPSELMTINNSNHRPKGRICPLG